MSFQNDVLRCVTIALFANLLWAGLGCQVKQKPQPPGTLDTTFSPVDVNNSVYAIAVQSDGKIVIGGGFTSVNNQPRWLLARVTPAGELDSEFTPRLTNKDLALVRVLAPQPDGTLLVGGDSGIFRVNNDGTPDRTFRVQTDSQVLSIAVGENGDVLAGGLFKTIAGQARSGLARLKQDGSLDSTFRLDFLDPHDVSCFISDIQPVKPSGYYLAGNFPVVGAASPVSLVKIGADGHLDTNFLAAVSGKIHNLALQTDGKILVAGEYLGKRVGLVRLLASGGLDETFDAGVNASDPAVTCVFTRPDGKIMAVGPRLTGVRGVPCAGFAALNHDGSPDTAFITDKTAAFHSDAMAIQPDGNIFLLSSTPAAEGSFPRGLVRLIGTAVLK